MKKSISNEELGIIRNLPALFRSRDLEGKGVSRGQLQKVILAKAVRRISRGVYRQRSAAISEFETVAAVSKRIPLGVICLLTALNIYGIGTQAPREVWIAVDRKARKPRVSDLPVRIVRFSGPLLRQGVQTKEMLGVPVKITSPARTVVDCFRYRNKIGMEVAMEALRDVLRSRLARVDEITRLAETCRCATVIRPYLEAIVS